MSELTENYRELGFSEWLEKEGSLLYGFRDLQLYQTLELDEEGNPITEEISSGLITLKTNKLSQAEIDEMLGKLRTENISDISQPINLIYGHIQSKNFVSGASGSGWRIDADGNLEANSGTFRGALAAASGTIGGWTIDSTSIYTGTEDHSGYTANAGDITIYSDGNDASIHAKNFYIDTSGNLTATGVTLTGAITATSGAIGGWTINSTSIYTGTEDHSGYTANAGDLTIYSDGSNASIHAKNFYIDTSGNF